MLALMWRASALCQERHHDIRPWLSAAQWSVRAHAMGLLSAP